MTFNINQIEKEVNYIFSSYPRHDMISMSKSQTYWLINRVKELEKELQRDVVEEWDLMKQNKRYREAIDRAIREGIEIEDCNKAIDQIYGILGKALEGEE